MEDPNGINERVLLTLVFVGALQGIRRSEFTQRTPESINAMNVDTEIENTVKRVAIVATLATSHSGAQFSTKNLVYPGCFCKLGVDLSGQKSVLPP
jgi:hypothetical protein